MISGFFNSPSSRVARSVLLQRNTPREMRGRVFSAFYVMRDVIFLFGMAGGGPGGRRRHPAADRHRRRAAVRGGRPGHAGAPGLGVATWGAAAARLRGADGRGRCRRQRRSVPRRWPTSTGWPAGSAAFGRLSPEQRAAFVARRDGPRRAGRDADHRARRRGLVRVLHPRWLDDGRRPGRRRLSAGCRR